MLGLISTKVPDLEPSTTPRRLTRPPNIRALSSSHSAPQCGLHPMVGNLISEDDQKRKLERVVETARGLGA